jgi:hypothetical protein
MGGRSSSFRRSGGATRSSEQRRNALNEYALNEYKKYRNEYIRVYREAQKAGKLHDRSVQANLQFLNERGAEIMNSIK